MTNMTINQGNDWKARAEQFVDDWVITLNLPHERRLVLTSTAELLDLQQMMIAVMQEIELVEYEHVQQAALDSVHETQEDHVWQTQTQYT